MEEEKPYWMNLTGGTSFSGSLRFELENYFPDAHYKQAIDQAFEKQAEDELLPDGGSLTRYYWSGKTASSTTRRQRERWSTRSSTR